jgi:Major Facilitator Superfamily
MLAEPVFNIIAGRATDRIGGRTPALFGYLLTALCMAWIAAFVDDDSYTLLLPGLILLSASIAPMFTSLLTGLSNAVSVEERGDANALRPHRALDRRRGPPSFAEQGPILVGVKRLVLFPPRPSRTAQPVFGKS